MATASKNIFWLSISRVVSLVLLFFAYTRLFRYLGPYNSGQYQFVLSFVTLFGVVIDFGVQQYVIKKMSEDRTQVKKYFHNFFTVEILLSVAVIVAMNLVAYLNHYEAPVRHAISLAGVGVALVGMTYPFLAVITSFYDLKKAALLNFISSFVNAVMIFATIYLHRGIVTLAAQQLIYGIIALVLYYHFVQKHIGKPQIWKGVVNFSWPFVKKMMIAALPFAALVGFSTLYNRIDVVLVTKILGYEQTGLYTAAYKFFDLLSFFPAVVSHSLYPMFVSMISAGKLPELKLMVEKYLRFMIALALPIAVGGMLFAKQIIVLLAGSQYEAAAPVLAILVWAPMVLFVYIVVNAIVISQLTRFAMAITGVNVVVNIVGNIILLHSVGIKGAAIMTLVSELLQGVFYFYFVQSKVVQFRFLALIWKPALAASVMGLVLWRFVEFPLYVAVPLGAMVYAGALLVLRFFKADDLAFVRQMLNRGGNAPA